MYWKLFDKSTGVALWFMVTISASIFTSAAFSHELISSRRDLEVALESAVKCTPDELGDFDGSRFDGDLNEKKELELLGVRVSKESRHGGEIVYKFPRGIEIFGHEVDSALYFDQSTTLFFVKLRSRSNNLNSINEILNLAPIRKGNPDGYGYFGEFDVRFLRKLHYEDDSPPDAIFSAVGNQNGRTYVVIGCQNLAW